MSIGVFHLVTRSGDVMVETTIEGFFAQRHRKCKFEFCVSRQHRPNSEKLWVSLLAGKFQAALRLHQIRSP
jgi:hypothetical protein